MGVTKRREPRGPVVRVTREWKDAVLRWLRVNEKSKLWLADEIGMPDSSGLTVLLEYQQPEHEEQETTTYGAAIAKVTGVALPEELLSDDERSVLAGVREALGRNPDNLGAILGFLGHINHRPKKT